jgi:glycosyltransferase involved in cell wall biosynthesis
MKGDQIRARLLAELLSRDHEVTVVTGGRPSSAAALSELDGLATVIAIRVGRVERALGALFALARGRPLQVGWMTPPKLWRQIVSEAQRADVALVVTIRCLPLALPVPTVLDHIDALSLNMRHRAHLERRLPVRAAARLEARLLAAHERRVAPWLAAQTAVSPIDADALPQRPRPVVVPHVLSTPVLSSEPDERDIDVIVTGDMRYPPNRDAAEWLAQEIVPELRRRRAGVRVVVAGRSADELAVRGVEVAADVPDILELLRRSRVAAVPLRNGTGSPTKLLEALACGAAVVATPWVALAAGIDVDTATDAGSFAKAIERLLADENLRQERADVGRAGVRARTPEVVRHALERLLKDAVAGASDQ